MTIEEPQAATSRTLVGGLAARRRDDRDGDRYVRVYSGLPAGGADRRHLLHALDHALLRARVRVPRRDKARFSTAASTPACRGFLVLRGAWLVILELTVLRLAWTFNLDFAHYELAASSGCSAGA